MSAAIPTSSYKGQTTGSAGFTLIELMVTVVVIAIIASIAAPNISTQLANQRVNSAAAILANALKDAKVESVIRRQDVTLTYNSASTPKTLILTANGNEISKFNVASQSTVTITPTTATTITFRPNKTISGTSSVVYTICDSSSTSETSKQITVNSIANIVTTNTGSC